FFIKNRDKYLCRCTKINSFGDIVTPKNAENSNCLDNYHCYYKQLARKTQECELLETQLESYHIGEPKLIQRIQELEQECEELKEENEELKAQRDTYVNLMNVYKNISKGRADSEIVIDYIDKLEKKLKIAEEALNDIKNSFFEDEDKEIITHAESIYYYSKAKEALQKMKEVQND
ncbi:MAG TPA: hypothetical protein IAC46_04190, partial [Candidatus Onthoplasma faecigallinarum]|nr:hypothetical protein [Candidatus Onthoplasma faecigallinarum]